MSLLADRYIVTLLWATAWAQQVTGPVALNVEGSTLQYQHRDWKIIKRIAVTFDAAAGPAELALLRSVQPSGTSGAGEPLMDVELLILQNGKVIYDYLRDRSNSSGPQFYMDDYLERKDVANDLAPAVLFHSGTRGASDWVKREHILRYDKSLRSLTDVAPEEFYDSGTHGLGWFTVATGTFVVLSDHNWNPGTPLEERCHYCSSPFKYAAYQWSGNAKAFVLYRQFPGKESYSHGDEALKGDQALIRSALQ